MKEFDYCFIYFNGRKDKLNDKKQRPDEFYYGYHYVKSRGYDVKILEFGTKDSFNYLQSKLLVLIQYVVLKLFKFQYDFAGIIKPNNWKTLKNSKNIILTNNRIAHSILPFLIYSKFSKFKPKFTVIAMGMFNSSSNKNYILKVHHFLHKLMIRNIDRLVFIGEPEYSYAIKKYPEFKNKIQFIPFGVDTEFWKKQKNNFEKNGYILFIGNDSKRDFDFLKTLIYKFDNIEFVVVTENSNFQNIRNSNVTVIKGSWNKDLIDDIYLRNLYTNAKMTIIPLQETLQPSGQSVALQSMSTETPVIITKTQGFWKEDDFKHLKNIYFVKNNNLKEWGDAINFIFENEELVNKITKNGRKLVSGKYSSKSFNNKLFTLDKLD
ncbi:MAG: glycosyltransferase family 4 protein [Gammaproteobacteria bacterium]|tara:strand:- start:841 stop:1974 length:1134 start_codon:yes stop_codon:yes gene_type:complete